MLNSSLPGSEGRASLSEAYNGARKGFIVDVNCGVLLLTGKEALSFVSRMSTNDLSVLNNQGACCATVLITEKAKIIDIVTIISTANGYLTLTSPGNAGAVKSWLERFIIMDDVQIEDRASEYRILMLHGSGMFEKFNLPSDLSPHSARITDKQIAFRDQLWPSAAVVMLKAGAEPAYEEAVPGLVETIRIEEGIPAFGKEITADVNPLEAGLGQFVSGSKGCYVGQEVLARLTTYKKVQKVLTGFIFADTDKRYLSHGEVFLSGRNVGTTTSHTWSPGLNTCIALGYLSTLVSENALEFKNDLLPVAVPIHATQLPFKRIFLNTL
ncbi:MAG TPA: glycine cleavage T C-terminal barrel domain-containing protein [Bacteroidota bacterium]|nr:glycine cleavage T C-terminal barrel domain-containing protein [Bacteroidota bacterium]